MNIPIEVATHEAGHLVVGLRLGLQEQGIVFRPVKPGEGADAWFTHKDPRPSLVRCFAGLLAVLSIMPDSIEPHLRRAYNCSIIFTPDHPHYDDLSESERKTLSGARGDMEWARIYASQLQPNDAASVNQRMHEAEQKARALVSECAPLIALVAADIVMWAAEPETDQTFMALYLPERAKEIIHRHGVSLGEQQRKDK